MDPLLVRIVASPPLPPHLLDEVLVTARRTGRVLAASADPDLHASCLTFGCERIDVADVAPVVEAFAGTRNAGRAYRVELLSDTPDDVTDEALRSLAVSLHGAFSAPVYTARRQSQAAAWALVRPMPWGRKGLAVGQASPALPFGGSECLGVALEVGTPTVLLKARLDAVPEHGLVAIAAAIGGADSGFADVGAYPAVSAADGASTLALEFGDVKRTPIHRALSVVDLEAGRYGGRLGQVRVLSHVPLRSLLDALAARTGLAAGAAQVLETHLPAQSRA